MNFEHMTDEEMNRIAKSSGIERKKELDNELRDKFAGIALQGIVSNLNEGSDTVESASLLAYMYADAMISQRNKVENDEQI